MVMMMKILSLVALMLGALLVSAVMLSGCINEGSSETYPDLTRGEVIPDDIQKRGPETDIYAPILYSTEFQEPVPLPYPINTAGAEDSPFILPDGNTLYFFFTPDVRVAPEKQLLDEVTGIWVSKKEGDSWQEPARVWLQDPGKLSLDGAVSIEGNKMYFASAREGYAGVNIFTATLMGAKWEDWEYVGDRLMKEIKIGEVHLHGNELYFHSDREGGKGGYDIWVTTYEGGSWSDPVNMAAVNTEGMDGYPFVSSDGNELWFTRTYMGTPAIFRSRNVEGVWQEPELIVSQFAGEPTLDDAGNIYFVHHYYENSAMIEADIYVAYRAT
ncbi:MAG: PD40 domain-containing protein [Candidatus Methanofastidiosa archaeon]|nr:PD40 domain-containing protein [Candidatus Methanofastidiosa archaeon]